MVLIKARSNEGLTLEDFKTVINIKTEQWINDPEYNKYLAPKTLFGPKFEAYLNENIQPGNSDIDREEEFKKVDEEVKRENERKAKRLAEQQRK